MNAQSLSATDNDTHSFRAGCCRIIFGTTTGIALLSAILQGAEPAKLIAHWPLSHDARDAVGALHGTAKNIEFGRKDRQAARFNGRDSVIRIPDAQPLHIGDRDFSLALWVQCETPLANT